MAVQAPSHGQRLDLSDLLHPVDPAVAGNAADATIDVGAVIEIDEIGQIVYPHPRNRFLGDLTFPDRQQFGTL